MLQSIHELAFIQTPLHLEGLHLDDAQCLIQKLLLVIHEVESCLELHR